MVHILLRYNPPTPVPALVLVCLLIDIVFFVYSCVADGNFSHSSSSNLTSSLAKFLCPLVELFKSFLADTGSDRFDTESEIIQVDWSNLIDRCGEQRLTKMSKWLHGGVFAESCHVRTRVAYNCLLACKSHITNWGIEQTHHLSN